jgi:hypothetical protein
MGVLILILFIGNVYLLVSNNLTKKELKETQKILNKIANYAEGLKEDKEYLDANYKTVKFRLEQTEKLQKETMKILKEHEIKIKESEMMIQELTVKYKKAKTSNEIMKKTVKNSSNGTVKSFVDKVNFSTV